MSTRDDILDRVRRHQPAAAPLPALHEDWIAFADREAQFIDVLTFVGGQCRVVASNAELEAELRQLSCVAGAKQIVCQVPGVSCGNYDLAAVTDPHSLANVDVAIMPGEFAVAENAAVWVTERKDAHRAVYFLTQHLVLVVPRAEIVDHLHQAYGRIAFPAAGYGLFISGPSKTADIEQALVIGAHGPRSLTVMLVG